MRFGKVGTFYILPPIIPPTVILPMAIISEFILSILINLSYPPYSNLLKSHPPQSYHSQSYLSQSHPLNGHCFHGHIPYSQPRQIYPPSSHHSQIILPRVSISQYFSIMETILDLMIGTRVVRSIPTTVPSLDILRYFTESGSISIRSNI